MANRLPVRNEYGFQWMITGANTYQVCGRTADVLPPGAYTVHLDGCGRPNYHARDVQTDEFIHFPDTPPVRPHPPHRRARRADAGSVHRPQGAGPGRGGAEEVGGPDQRPAVRGAGGSGHQRVLHGQRTGRDGETAKLLRSIDARNPSSAEFANTPTATDAVPF